MAWVAVDDSGEEYIYGEKPERDPFYKFWRDGEIEIQFELPEGSIKKLIGKNLTWEDEPKELT